MENSPKREGGNERYYIRVFIQFCYQFTQNYVLAITLFTLLTKVLLFPVSMWTHRNGIKMVELMPEIDRLKIDYYGDNAAVAEKNRRCINVWGIIL